MCVRQVLAVCIIQWERVRGCRSSVVLFLYWLLSVVCSLIPLRAKIQLAVEQVREMTHSKNLGHPFHGSVLKPRKTTHSHTTTIHTNPYTQTYTHNTNSEKNTHAWALNTSTQRYFYQRYYSYRDFWFCFVLYDIYIYKLKSNT